MLDLTPGSTFAVQLQYISMMRDALLLGEFMSKEVTMTIRVEADLRSRFSAVAEAEGLPAAQVLRGLMREYVEQAKPLARPLISDDERRSREEAINYGIASVGLEGFTVDADFRKTAARFISGELDRAEFIAEVVNVDRNA